MKNRKIVFSPNAAQDLKEIYRYIINNDSFASGKAVYQNIKSSCLQLANFPNKEKIPPELARISVLRYHQIVWKPYRIIYKLSDETIYIMAILDGRRNLEELLTKRLLR